MEGTVTLTYDSRNIKKLTKDAALWWFSTRVANNISNKNTASMLDKMV